MHPCGPVWRGSHSGLEAGWGWGRADDKSLSMSQPAAPEIPPQAGQDSDLGEKGVPRANGKEGTALGAPARSAGPRWSLQRGQGR